MAWTLAELSKIETDTLRKSIIDGLLYEANFIDLVPWETIGQLSMGVVRYKDLPSVGFRLINGSYTESTGKLEQQAETMAIMGLDIDTDVVIARAKNTIADARAIQQQMALKSWMYSFNDKFINGDITNATTANTASVNKEFNGLKKRIADIYVEGIETQLIDGGTAGTNRGILYDTTSRNIFIDNLDKLIYSIRGHSPDVLLMNQKMLLATRACLRREQLLSSSQDMFGRQIDMYGKVRLVDVGVKADQITEIITNQETDSGGTEETSIYAVKFGIGDMLWGIQEFPLEARDLGEIDSKPVYRTRMEWPLGLAHVDSRCMARLYGVVADSDAS